MYDPDGERTSHTINAAGTAVAVHHHQIRVASAASSSSSKSSSPSSPSHFSFLALASYWFSWSLLWLPLLVVIIPYQILSLATDTTNNAELAAENGIHAVPASPTSSSSKGSTLGSTLLLGSFFSLLCSPLFGSLSDSSLHYLGRRRPYMLVGCCICTFALICMSCASSLSTFSTSFLLLSIGNNMILAPYSALLPDTIPYEHRGIASGYLSFMSICGYLVGGVCVYFILDLFGLVFCYFILTVLHAAGMGVTCYYIQEVPIKVDDECHLYTPKTLSDRFSSFLLPFQSSYDFRILFLTRFLMQMGILIVQEYAQYYLQDAIGNDSFIVGSSQIADTPQRAVSILFIPVLLGALLSSLIAGIVSDKILGGKRKVIVYISGICMTISCVLFGLTRDYAFDLFLGFLFGLGYGAFACMDWAMATDILPNPYTYGKDMGIWNLSLVLPQVFATPIAGCILDYVQEMWPHKTVGYTMVFLMSALFISVATYMVSFLKTIDTQIQQVEEGGTRKSTATDANQEENHDDT